MYSVSLAIVSLKSYRLDGIKQSQESFRKISRYKICPVNKSFPLQNTNLELIFGPIFSQWVWHDSTPKKLL